MPTALQLIAVLGSVSWAVACGPDNNITCVDGKRFYQCTKADMDLFGDSSDAVTMDNLLLLQHMLKYAEKHGLPTCDGHCTTHGCEDSYKPLHNECECNEHGYACTSLTSYKYCTHGQKMGSHHIECPDGEVCHYNDPLKTRKPCMRRSEADHSLAMHCYHPLNSTDSVVKDYSGFCRTHGRGSFLVPDVPVCDYFIRCDPDKLPSFSIEHCPVDHGFNLETGTCDKTESFFCAAEKCQYRYGDLANFNQKNCSSFVSCNGGHFIEIGSCPEPSLFNPRTGECDESHSCIGASHRDYMAVCSALGPGNHPVLTDKSCSAYLHCEARTYSLEFCPENTTFDGNRGKCGEGTCSNELLSIFCDENGAGVFAHPTDFNCQAYIQCHTNPLLHQIKFCQANESFNIKTLSCEKDHKCRDDKEAVLEACRGRNSELIPDPIFNCSYFIACHESSTARFSCKRGEGFDPKSKVCASSYSSCGKSKPKLLLGSALPTASEDPDYQNFHQICQDMPEGSVFADCTDVTCKSYIKCTKRSFERKSCPRNESFSEELNECSDRVRECKNCENKEEKPLPIVVVDRTHRVDIKTTCAKTLKTFREDEMAIPKPYSKDRYYVCQHDDSFEERTCCRGYEFCAGTRRCEPPKKCPESRDFEIQYVLLQPTFLSLSDFNILSK